MITIAPSRAARLLLLAVRMAKPRVLGDFEGHPFRGNQWTEEEGGDKDSPDEPSDKYDEIYGGGEAAIEKVRDGDYILLKNVADVTSTNIAGLVDEAIEERKYVRKSIDLTNVRLQTEQEFVGAEKVKSIMGKWDKTIRESPPISIAKNKATGELTITDGNHRLVAAVLRGDKWIVANIVTLPGAKFKALRSATGKEGPLHKVADSHAAKLSVAIRYAFAAARKAMRRKLVDRSDVREAAAIGIVTLRAELKDVLPGTLRRMFVDGGQAGARMLVKGLRAAGDAELRTAKREPKSILSFAFNAATKAAIDWADRHAAELIDQISETSREAINNAVSEFLETGDFDELRDEVLAAVGDERRADLIARNEPMVAVHEGQREAWDQAVDAGLLTGDEERGWIVVGDERVCPICEGLDGKTAKIGEPYVGDDGEEYDGPPAHVMCRCSEGIVGTRALGDFEGHPFRGNQYTDGIGGENDSNDYSLPESDEDPAPGNKYFYHQTPRASLAKVQAEGLKRKEGSQNPISLSPHLSSVHEWSGLLGGKGEMALVRVERRDVRPAYSGEPIEEFDEDDKENPDYDPAFPMRTSEYDPRDFSAELATFSNIPAEKLQVFYNGSWWPIARVGNER